MESRMGGDITVEVISDLPQITPAPYSLSKKQLYANLPLLPGFDCIRLLDIDPPANHGTQDSSPQITGHLRTVKLSQGPTFLSLSYVWGEMDSNVRCVALPSQGCNIELTENCYQALRHVRDRLGKVTIWVDAICINQEDDKERHHQIPLMEEIYSLAETVYAWLGPGNAASDKAMDYLKRRARLARRMPLEYLAATDSNARERCRRKYRRKCWGDVRARMAWPLIRTGGVNLDEVLDREWIHRSWTFQEFLLARNIMILCGKKAIAWEDLASALRSVPRGSGSSVSALLPVSRTVWDHWRSITSLWFNLSRPRLSKVVAHQDSLTQPSTFKQQIGSLRKLCMLPRGIHLLYWPVVVPCYLAFATIWGYTSYRVVLKVKMTKLRGVDWYLFSVAWLIATCINVFLIGRIRQRWHFTIYGWKHEWLLDEHMEAAKNRLLDALCGALRERKSSNPRDKAYALYGVLKAEGAALVAPDYSLSISQTFQNLVQDLLTYDHNAIALIMDAGSRGQHHGPSWIPNWQVPVPSAWLTSDHILGVSPVCTQPQRHIWFKLMDSKLQIFGVHTGTIAFDVGNHHRCDLAGECMVTVLHDVLRWWAHFRHTVSPLPPNGRPLPPNDLPLSSFFAILDGLSPRRGPTGELLEGKDETVWWEYPLVRGLYDFSSRKTHFEGWLSLYKILEARFPLGEADSHSIPIRSAQEVLLKIKATKSAHVYLQRIHDQIKRDRRSLFLLSSGLLGTGPPELKLGDEVYLLPGIPVPMALRRTTENNYFRVIGAVMVHGLMHGEDFNQDGLEKVVLV